MTTIETKLYSFAELSAEARARVIQRKADQEYAGEDYTLEECMDSLKAIIEACGCSLADYQIGAYNRSNYASANGECSEKEFRAVLRAHGYNLRKKNKFPGICGFTGVCFDEDVAETMLEALREGEDFSHAVDRAADKIREICENDLEYRASEEGILEYLDQSEEIYTEDGNEF